MGSEELTTLEKAIRELRGVEGEQLAKLNELETERDIVKARLFDARMRLRDAMTLFNNQVPKKQFDEGDEWNLEDIVLMVLNREPSRRWRPIEVIDIVRTAGHAYSDAGIRTALNRVLERGLADRPTRGRYWITSQGSNYIADHDFGYLGAFDL